MLFEASFLAGNLIRAMSAQKPDLLLIVSPPLGLGVTARLLSGVWKIPYVFDVMDLQPDAAAELGMLREGALMRFLYRLEKSAYENASLVSTLTEGMRQRIVGKAIPESKVALFAVCPDQDLFLIRRGIDGKAFRHAHALDGKFVVLHSGNMGVKQGLGVILETAKFSRNIPDIVYLLVGDGAMRHELEAQATAKRLANIKFLPVQQRASFFEVLAAADVSLITQQRSVSDIVFPSKTATLMTAGCPLIASVNSDSEVARVVRESGAGFVVTPEKPEPLFDAITDLRDNPNNREEMGFAGRQYAHQYWTEQIVLPKMESELLRLVQSNQYDSPRLETHPGMYEDRTAVKP